MSHACHYPPCKQRTQPRYAFCRDHWSRLPKIRQDAIWSAFQQGQCERRVSVSKLWLAAMREAMADLFEQDGDQHCATGSREMAERFRALHHREQTTP